MLLCTQDPEHINNGNVSGSNFPRGNNNNNNNNQGGNFPRGNGNNNNNSGGMFPRGNGNGHQGNPGNPLPGNHGNQNTQPKQGKRPADGDSKPSKKQKMNNDNEKKWASSTCETFHSS
jgi:hypothetical protein